MSAHTEEDDFMEELKREFKATITRNMIEFTTLLQEGKFEDIARIAHDIKGTAGLFELEQGREIAMKLQQTAQNKDAEGTQALIAAMAAYMKEAGITAG